MPDQTENQQSPSPDPVATAIQQQIGAAVSSEVGTQMQQVKKEIENDIEANPSTSDLERAKQMLRQLVRADANWIGQELALAKRGLSPTEREQSNKID